MKKLLLTLVALGLACTLSAQKTADDIQTKKTAEGTRTQKTVFDFKTPAQKKWNFGVSAGYLYSSALWINREVNSGPWAFVKLKGKHGFTAGLVGEWRQSVGLGIGLGARFSMGGFKTGESTENGNIEAIGIDFTRYTVDIPVVANIYIGQQRKWFVQAGVNTSILVAGDAQVGGWWNVRNPTVDYTMNPIVAQLILGGGWGPVSAQILWGVTPVWTSDFRGDLAEPQYNRRVVYNSPIGISVSYTYMF